MKTKVIIAPILAACTGKDDFVAKLKEAKVDVLFRYTAEGRIYGVTFIDHNNMVVLNGSRIGREFSANALEARFNDHQRQRTVEPEVQLPVITVQDTFHLWMRGLVGQRSSLGGRLHLRKYHLPV